MSDPTMRFLKALREAAEAGDAARAEAPENEVGAVREAWADVEDAYGNLLDHMATEDVLGTGYPRPDMTFAEAHEARVDAIEARLDAMVEREVT